MRRSGKRWSYDEKEKPLKEGREGSDSERGSEEFEEWTASSTVTHSDECRKEV